MNRKQFPERYPSYPQPSDVDGLGANAMPGPVSDSYDPVWGTAANGDEVRDAIRAVREKLAAKINAPPDYILDVVRRDNGAEELHSFSVRELRILRFACGVALEEEDL